MPVIESMHGAVLLVGDFNKDLQDYLSQFCQVNSVLNSYKKLCEGENIRYVTVEESCRSKYNAIIINGLGSSDSCGQALFTQLYNDCLEEDGSLCYLEKNRFALKYVPGNYLSKITSLFSDSGPLKTHKSDFFRITSLPTICYDGEPHESFMEGAYSSNKNVFLWKEKIRLAILRSRFSKLFVQANLWLLAKNNSVKFLHKRIIEHYAKLNTLNINDFQLANILYNKGKLLFLFRNIQSTDESIIAVLTYQERTYKQRLNEQVMLNHLSSYSAISKYLPQNHEKFNLYGYDIFAMRECQGVTVDSNSKHLPAMTENIGRVLLDVSLVSQKNVPVRPEPIAWLNTIQTRIPGYNDQINELKKYVSEYSSNISVVMHGDAKIENFVLNKHNQVVGIIDWEQGIVNGFPLLDLYYLFAYNYQLKNNTDFNYAFKALCETTIPAYEKNILNNYCNEMKLTEKDRAYLLIVFFIHHYSCRYDVGPDTGNVWDVYKSSLGTAINLARRQFHG